MALRKDTPELNMFLNWAAQLRGNQLDVNSIADSLGPSLASISVERSKLDAASKQWNKEFNEKVRINDSVIDAGKRTEDFNELSLLVEAGFEPNVLADTLESYDWQSERGENFSNAIASGSRNKGKKLNDFNMRILEIDSGIEKGVNLNNEVYDKQSALEDYKKLSSEILTDADLNSKFGTKIQTKIAELQKDVFKEESKGLVDSMFPHLDTDQRTNLANMAVYMPPQDFMRILEGDLYKDPMKAMDAETRAITISNLTRLAEDGHPGAQILLNHLIKQDLRTEGLIGKNEYTLNLTSGENIVVNQDGTAKLVYELGNISDVPYNLTEEQKKEILQGGGVPKNFFNSK